MNYQEFITLIEKAFSDKLGKQHFKFHQITRNNGVIYDGIMILESDLNISPLIYLAPYYDRYRKGDSVETICNDILECYQKYQPKQDFDSTLYTDYEKAKKRIIYRLVNYERNRELLKEIPHVRYLDFAIIFYCLLSVSSKEQAGILIYKHHLSFWNIDTDTLFSLARENTPKLLPIHIEDMAGVILSLMGPTGLSLADLNCPMYILTNKYRTNGATVLLYDSLLPELSNHFHSDLIIIPSSIHEVLILPIDQPCEAEVFRSMIAQVNENELSSEEILSDNAYIYKRDEGTLMIY